MNRRDEELLARQLRHMNAAPSDRLLGPVMLAVFIVGFFLGGLLFTRPGDSPGSPKLMASIGAPNAPAIVRR